MRWVVRVAKYVWASPTTVVGLAIGWPALLSKRGGAQWVDGVLEFYGGWVGFFLRRCTLLKGGASAMTLGHVVLGRDRDCLEWSRAHERVHVRQCERWGPLFLPAYGVASVVGMLSGRGAYFGNWFEREAYEDAG